MRTTTTRRATLTTAAALAALLLSGCGTDPAPAAGTDPTDATPSLAATQDVTEAGDLVTVTDPWVKAVDEGMTAAFATFTNESDRDVVIVSASTAVSPMVELHEMAMTDGAMVMREKAGGITIPAGGTAELGPGGDHIMLMAVSEPVQPGDVITVTLTFDDGSTLDVEATAKDYTGADEEYEGGGDGGGMDMTEPSMTPSS